jgi:hypothetical protein
MAMDLYKEARKAILVKLFNMNKWGGSHTHFKHMLGSLPKDVRGAKEVKKAIKDLIKEGKLLPKQTTQEPHVSLNPEKAKDIKEEIAD